MMTDQNKVFTVAERILATDLSCDKMKLHKLLYYVQGWSQAWTGRPLFQEAPEAWKFGPVYKSVYAEQWDSALSPHEHSFADQGRDRSDRCRRERIQDKQLVESCRTNSPRGTMDRGTCRAP